LKKILSFACVVFFIGCATHPMDPEIKMTPPKYVEQMPSQTEENVQNPGSLFTNSDNLFADTKAKRVNDIVTVVITENVSQIFQSTKKLNESDNSGGGNVNAGISGGVKVNGHGPNIGFTGINLSLPSMSSNRSFSGSGSQNTKQQFQTTISARIVKVLKNGNYYIYGTKEMLLNGEKQIIEVSGVIRPQDITPDNIVYSKNIADEKIIYKSEGDINEYTHQNWFARFWNKIAPW